MPELPEVEITRRGLLPDLVGTRVTAVALRAPALRYPLPADLATRIVGQPLRELPRRGKYLLFRFDNGELLLHLGMSGSLRIVAPTLPAEKHDHVDIVFDGKAGKKLLRLRDPRRFGALLWLEGDTDRHPLIAPLGIEPLDD